MSLLTAALLAVALLNGSVLADTTKDDVKKEEVKKAEQPQVEVVFCLDTTGSMGGLINAAKQKIWAISNQIAGGKPTPRVKVGLLAFRDRGDAYVTQIYDLSEDLDAIHGHLMKFQAQGGGDFPESVNQAIHESVTKMSWSKSKNVLKMIFLVGDAPPHVDYKDDVQYAESCKIAVKNDIIINTVQCGNNAETLKYWKEIAHLSEGSYVQIDAQGGNVVVVATPFDKELAEINTEMSRTTLVFGDRRLRAEGEAKKDAAAKLAAPAAAERAGFAGKSGRAASYDLLDSIRDGKVKLESLKKDELPEELQKLTLDEQKTHLKKLEERRGELSKKAVDLDKQRSDYIAKEMAKQNKDAAANSFDGQVLRMLQRQATRVNLRYVVPGADVKKD